MQRFVARVSKVFHYRVTEGYEISETLEKVSFEIKTTGDPHDARDSRDGL
jgi:hypothetical protein